MKKDNILKTVVIPGTLALAAVLLSLLIPIDAARLVGFAIIFVLLAIAALEYGVKFKRLVDR